MEDIFGSHGIFVRPNLYNMTTKRYREKMDLVEFLQWGRRNPSRFIEEVFNVQLMDYQRYLIDSSWNKPFVVWAMSRNGGKALSLDTPIITPDGSYRTMGDLDVGDYVVGDDGRPAQIIATSPIFTDHQCFELTFDDGEKIVADADHIWSVYNKHDRCRRASRWILRDLTTKELAKNFVRYRKDNGYPEYKYAIPLCKPIEFPEKELPIHPYILGLWLGDGCSYHGVLSSGNADYQEMCNIINSHGGIVYSVRNDTGGNKLLTLHSSDDIPIQTLLRENNLLYNKHIPDVYINSSIEQRLDFVRGLMDTDGYTDGKNCYFYNSNRLLIDGLVQILDSLGIKNKVTDKKTKCNGKIFDSYVVTFAGSKELPLFYLKRKYERLPEKLIHRRTYKTIINIREVETVPTKCICVNNATHRFLCGYKNTVTHNSLLASLFIMAKMLLVPNFKSYILAGVGSQSIEMFNKMEQFAMKNIASFTNLNDIFQSNVVKSQSNSTGWVHNPASYTVRTYGGSQCFTLNGAFDNNRSKRSNLNVYDEAMNAPDELFHTSMPFTTQNSEFKMGKGFSAEDLLAEPTPFPNQLLFCSSAGRTDQYFFKVYRDYSIRMFAGDKRYFVADVSCDIIINATVHNKLWPVPLLTQEKVDQAMREDKEAALREYKNIFTSEGGDGQIIRRATIVRNSVPRPPKLTNDTNSKYALLYDSARSKDNSVVLCAEYYKDPVLGWKMRIQNVVNLLNTMKKKKTPMTTPNQIKEVKRLLLEYNGEGVPDYDNILGLWIDAGSGGAGVNISDFFWEDWEDDNGVKHRGLIDKEYSPEEASLYPNAIKDKMRLIQPAKYKSEMFKALIEMMDQNLIEFPNEYDNRGYLMLMYDVNTKTGEKTPRYVEPSEKEVKDLAKKGIEIVQEKYHLSAEEEIALKQIDAMKTELVNIYRFKQSSGGDRFDLAPDSAKKMNDDRAYVAALAAYLLQQLRREHLVTRKRPSAASIIDQLPVTPRKGFNKLFG